ncbi:mevalonate kinase [Sulfurisphaera ohwakuensis]|uniref:mevalonate kinase n=1 Tax=Sulfurisphaera ohwakuensis TaxID=69656 RepID=UPI0036F1F6EC
MIEVKVPLKLTLFGEHAVVYERPAIAYTISEFLTLRFKESDKFYIKSDNLQIKGVRVNIDEFKIENENIKRVLSYIIEGINYFEAKKPVEIEIESPVEPSVGLGTSAGVVVGTVAGYSSYLGIELSKEEIAKISHSIELKVQGLGSRMDTYTETFGGFVYIEKDKFEKLSSNLTFSAGYFRRVTTTAEMLKRVKQIKEKKRELFDSILDTIAKITIEAKKALQDNDEDSIGELMYINHGLLFSLGITVPQIDEFISTSRMANVKGCKISGGGAGGAVVCTKDERAELLLTAMGGKVINATPSFLGVQVIRRT